MREYLFCAKSGFYVVDKPKGFEWGPGELDPRQFTVVRAVTVAAQKLFDDKLPDLVEHRMRLRQPVHYSGMKNIWLGGALEKTPERDWTPAPEYVVLRTGRRCKTEEELWGCVVEGDRAFHSTNPQDPGTRGILLTITSVEPRRFELKRDVTLAEAEEGLSSFGAGRRPPSLVPVSKEIA